jgi:hypothetical protein
MTVLSVSQHDQALDEILKLAGQSARSAVSAFDVEGSDSYNGVELARRPVDERAG